MSKNSGTGEPVTRAGLFKIRHLGEGQYSIRSMLDNRMGLMYSSTDVYLGNVGTSADNVPTNARWIIHTNDSGYYVRGANTGKSLTLPNVVNDGVEVSWSTYNSNYLNYNWFITKSTQTIHGIDITQKTDTLVLGNTFQFGAVFYSTTSNINGQNLVWDIDENASTGSADIDSNGVLTPISTGTIIVTIDYARNGVKQWGDSWEVDIIPLRPGMYYIQNTSTQKHMQADDSGGAYTEVYDFTFDSLKQRWELIYIGNNYYQIRNIGSDMFLTAPSDAINASPVTLQNYDTTIANRQLWRFEQSTSGIYTIQSKAREGTALVLAANLNASTGDIQVQQRSDLASQSLWSIYGITYSYVNYYDSTFVDSHLLDYIALANEFANIVYGKLWNISFQMDVNAIFRSDAIADQCTTGTHTECNSASCGIDCNTDHHKNCWVVAKQLYYGNREDNHIYIMWSNRDYHTYCKVVDGVHTTEGAIAMVYNFFPVIQFLTISGTAEEQLACMAIVLVHETAHTFKHPDVYNNVGHDHETAFLCSMERFDAARAYQYYEDVCAGRAEPFCESCKSALHDLVMERIIEGN